MLYNCYLPVGRGYFSINIVSRNMVKGMATLTKPRTDFFPLSAIVTNGIVSILLITHWGRCRSALRAAILVFHERNETRNCKSVKY